jgi:hypothetical protein
VPEVAILPCISNAERNIFRCDNAVVRDSSLKDFYYFTGRASEPPHAVTRFGEGGKGWRAYDDYMFQADFTT